MKQQEEYRTAAVRRARAVVSQQTLTRIASKNMTPAFVVNRDLIVKQLDTLRRVMPNVEPHFAVKSCPMPEVLKILKSAGAHLDVASDGEIKLLKRIHYPARLLIHTHPHKTVASMKTAYRYGIRTFTLDDPSEIAVLEPYKKHITVMLRLGFSNTAASIDLSYKFGLAPAEAVPLIHRLLDEGFTIGGCSFHVGSQMTSAAPYKKALRKTAAIYKEIKKTRGYAFTKLDIGGGFPAPYRKPVPTIKAFAHAINPLIQKYFSDIDVFSEPGRYIINPCVALVTKVINTTTRTGKDWVFIDDGIYGAYADMLSGHSTYQLLGGKELTRKQRLQPYVVGGPTCDSIDVIDTAAQLPKLSAGDLMVTPDMGAYSFALASEFNSIPIARVIVV